MELVLGVQQIDLIHHSVAGGLADDAQLGGINGDGKLDIASKIWRRWPGNANDSKFHADWMENVKCRILTGIDIGIPTGKGSRKASPEDTYAAVSAALKAGADGLVLSRKYSEMRLANLSAAGRVVREHLG